MSSGIVRGSRKAMCRVGVGADLRVVDTRPNPETEGERGLVGGDGAVGAQMLVNDLIVAGNVADDGSGIVVVFKLGVLLHTQVGAHGSTLLLPPWRLSNALMGARPQCRRSTHKGF